MYRTPSQPFCIERFFLYGRRGEWFRVLGA